VTTNAEKREKLRVQAEKRAEREKAMAAKILALPRKQYGVILADPPWQFETWSDNGLGRSAENHYPTVDTTTLANLPVDKLAAEDCFIAMWCVNSMLPQALHVMSAWGFEYKTNGAWIKGKMSLGYWMRGRHELFLLGTRGQVPAPSPDLRPVSTFFAHQREHSRKPDDLHEILEGWFPNVPKLELFARNNRPGWDSWGTKPEGMGF